MSKQQLVTDIVGFLEQSITKGEVAGDEKESLELAIDCIRETFKVSDDAKPGDLLEIYKKGMNSSAPLSSSSASVPAAASASSTSESVSEEDKTQAEELKAKGNKLMSQRKYQEAVDAYTEAIAKNPHKALFYSNRAAAFTYLSLSKRAVEDARKSIELDPNYSKGYSRLGLALWSEGDLKGSLDAYEAGIKAEGESPSEGMKRDYEQMKKRYAEEMAKRENTDLASQEAGQGEKAKTGPGAGFGAETGPGGFDMSQLSSFMNNPQIQQMAKGLMSDPDALKNIMNSPMAKSMQERMRGGNMPNMSELGDMMNNEEMQDMMKNFK